MRKFRDTYSITSFHMKKKECNWLEWNISKMKHEYKKPSHCFLPTPLIFKLQQEVLKFNEICVNWSLPKTDLETNFLNLENPSFEKVSFHWHSFTYEHRRIQAMSRYANAKVTTIVVRLLKSAGYPFSPPNCFVFLLPIEKIRKP